MFAVQNEYRDPSVAQNALHVLSSYLLYSYPEQIKLTKEEVIVVFGYVSKHLLLIDTSDLEDVCVQKGLDFDKINDQIKEIEEDLNNF